MPKRLELRELRTRIQEKTTTSTLFFLLKEAYFSLLKAYLSYKNGKSVFKKGFWVFIALDF